MQSHTRAGRLLTLLGAVLIAILRRPDQIAHPQFFAEDAWFYRFHRLYGWHVLQLPYAGYLNTTLRLIAGTAAWCDPRWAPACCVAMAGAITLYAVSRALSPRQPLAGPLFALAVVLVPSTLELFLNGTNAQWFVGAAFLLLLTSRDPATPAETIHDFIVALLAGLTGPFGAVLTPLFAWRFARRRSGASLGLLAVVAATAVVQARFIIPYHDPNMPNSPARIADIIGVIGTRVGGSLFCGSRLDAASPFVLRCALALGTVALAGVLAGRAGRHRFLRASLGAAFGLFLAADLYRCRGVLADLQNPTWGARYFFLPQLLLLWLLIAALRDRSPLCRRLAAGLLILFLAANLGRFREPPLEDLDWARYAGKIAAGQAVSVPVNPGPMMVPFPALTQ